MYFESFIRQRAAPNAFGVGREFDSPWQFNNSMPWIYILRGSSGRHYIGSSVNLEARLTQHRRGNTYTTKRLGEDLELVASKRVATLDEARSIERALKAKKNPPLAIHYLQQ